MTGNVLNVWDASEPAENDLWVELWESAPSREVSAHPSYGRLFAGSGERLLCASFVGDDGGVVLYPFLYRDLSHLGAAKSMSGQLADISTPYGYGGPLTWGSSNADALAAEFWLRFDEWALRHNVVTEFIRFSLTTGDLLPHPGDRHTRMVNIVRSLEPDEETIWMDFEQKVRKNVKKAQRNGVTVAVDLTGARIDEFLGIYEATMERRDADSGYYFPRTFFESIHRELPGNFAYFHASHEGRVVSTELVLVSDDVVYSFLGGTDESAFEHRPNDLLKYEVMRWAKDQGKRAFVLGGGASPGDGIERYKRAFAPSGSVDFVTGQRILNPGAYEQLLSHRQRELDDAGREWPADSGYFPAYRAPM
jgi:Acetyltransferase (GNAT) domain